jgi:exo-beta-1,3-glucanase (GH17 family)
VVAHSRNASDAFEGKRLLLRKQVTSRPMHYPVTLFALVAAAIVAVWWRLGAPQPMPGNPLAAGEKLYCVSYTPFRGRQSPLDPATEIDPRQIEDDMVRLKGLTDCVRTYSTRNGLDRVAEIAERHGIKVMQGIWLGGDPAAAERDVAVAIALAKRFPQTIRSVVVGNEVLLRGEMTADGLAAAIRRVKAEIPQPVTYADVWEFWLRHRAIHDAVDFVTIHILPYWEDDPVPARNAAAHVEAIRRMVTAEFAGKEIVIGETGWPSAGRMRAGALPSPVNQARVMHDVLNVAKRQNYHVNLIEAFDQPWKRRLEGTVGGHWGLLDAERRTPKFAWGVPVSNHPHWRLQAAAGLALAALTFAAALTASRRRRLAFPVWLGVAAMALTTGILIGWAVADVPLESLSAGDWLRSITLVGLAIAAPLIGAAALARGEAVPGFANIFGGSSVRPQGALAWALGLALIVLCVVAVQVALGLVFDPRYKDFPFAPLTAAAAPFLVLALPRRAGRLGTAEIVFAAVLTACAVYIVLNEGFANWQALWLAAVLVGLAFSLMRVRDAPG